MSFRFVSYFADTKIETQPPTPGDTRARTFLLMMARVQLFSLVPFREVPNSWEEPGSLEGAWAVEVVSRSCLTPAVVDAVLDKLLESSAGRLDLRLVRATLEERPCLERRSRLVGLPIRLQMRLHQLFRLCRSHRFQLCLETCALRRPLYRPLVRELQSRSSNVGTGGVRVSESRSGLGIAWES